MENVSAIWLSRKAALCHHTFLVDCVPSSKMEKTQMFCPDILARTLSVASSGGSNKGYAHGNSWQYHSRSDRHSKIVSWGLTFDLMNACPLLREHVADGKVSVGINHEMRDFRNNKKKNLDLVLCRSMPGGGVGGSKSGKKGAVNFAQLAASYNIQLQSHEQNALSKLPNLPIANVSSVLLAIEAKAAMTEFGKALPRLKDELTASFQTIHGDTESAIAAGIVMINMATEFISTDRNEFDLTKYPPNISTHKEGQAEKVITGMREIQRRSRPSDTGFDGMGILLLNCRNDGITPVTVDTVEPRVLPLNDDFNYGRFIERLAHLYATRFSGI
ncbi:hypothetical protein [Pseudomonas sp. Irchel s3a10]|uniref:hypothetical protein n=1 Tax=Pseudomonas sp. Irchel s3a10 TaxID=2009045 RepID=UPI00117B4A93|nr:hypothetical protein [Pseudomonas sp. Irchel s3a10]